MSSPRACTGCPLAVVEPDAPPSLWLRHLVWLSGLQAVGVQFHFTDLTAAEWQGLKLLKIKRDEKSARDMKKR